MLNKYSYIIVLFLIYLRPIDLLATTNNFLVISDIHLNATSSHQMSFMPQRTNIANDLDYRNFQQLITTIATNIKNKNISKPNFILLLGDIQSHARMFNKVKQNEIIVFQTFKKYFPKIPIFYVFGNNDSLQKNYGLFNRPLRKLAVDSNCAKTRSAEPHCTLVHEDSSIESTKQVESAVEFPKRSNDSENINPYKLAIENGGWKNGFLSTGNFCNVKNKYPCLQFENSNYGYYSAILAPKLHLIALNSVLFSNKNSTSKKQDGIEQLSWLKQQLKTAEKNNDFILIALHIPPGYSTYNNSQFWQKDYLQIFLKIIQQYHKNIIGILSAHTHQEEITIIKNRLNQPITGIYSTAALSTAYGNSPSIKTFYFTKFKTQWALNNYKTYQFSKENSKITLKELYDFTNYYCNNKKTNMNECLINVSSNKIENYLRSGNNKVSHKLRFPKNFELLVK